MLDIFRSDAFSIVSLTEAINKIKFVPGYLGGSGLFTPDSISTTTVGIEEQGGILKLVAPSPRGAPGNTLDKALRKMRYLSVPHFEINDAVMAEEVQGVRAFGSETGTEAVMTKVGQRMQVAGQSLEVTKEFSRIGAVKGVITYADSSTLSLFTEFEVSQVTEIDFDLDNASPAAGALRKKCASVVRTMGAQLDGVPFSGLESLCGDAFFDDLIAHVEVRATYLQQAEASELRQGYLSGGQVWGMFQFGGIRWINYRGSVGATTFVDTDKCHIYPIGVPGLFKEVHAPADYIETVNTMGRPYYTKQYQMQNDKGIHLDTQTNVLHYCTRPNALIPGRRT